MSPNGPTAGSRVAPVSNIYTVILAVAFSVVLVTAALMAYKCYIQYGTVFKIP